jgi:hypothetical protein
MWHWIIPFSFTLFLFTVGCVQGYSYTVLSQADNQKDDSMLGIKRCAAQFARKTLCPLGYMTGGREETALRLTQRFAGYVGNPQAGSAFSRWNTVGIPYSQLLISLFLCCFPFLNWQEEGRDGGNCVGHLAKGGLMLVVLALGWDMWVHGRVAGWYFEMQSIAKRLRRECLRQGMELEKGEASSRDRLEALLREILQEGVVEKDEKDSETLVYERMVIDSIVERIRC